MAFTQPATFNEEWSDERVFSHLNQLPELGESRDFAILYSAYKHMRPSDFERMIPEFLARGFSLNSTNAQQQTFAQVVANHPSQSAPFLAIIDRFN